jgi:hypothetical protein
VKRAAVSGASALAVAAAQAGFTGQGLRLAVAVGLAESGGNPTARGPNPPTPGCPAGSLDQGAWQLNNCNHPEVSDTCADDLACAAVATYRISAAGSDWSEWTTYSSGAYRAQLAVADQALAVLIVPTVGGDIPPGYGTPGPCGLSPATDYTRRLVTELFGIADIGGCAVSGHIENSDHHPEKPASFGLLKVLRRADGAEFAQLAWVDSAREVPSIPCEQPIAHCDDSSLAGRLLDHAELVAVRIPHGGTTS